MTFDVTLYQRLTTTIQPTTGLIFKPLRYSKRVHGGCYRATIEVTGQDVELDNALNNIGCGIEVYNAIGILVWWGYIHEARIEVGKFTLSASLDNVANKIKVAYSYVDPGTSEVGERKVTAFTSDTESQGAYGIKELIYSTAGASSTFADAMRDTLLADMKLPYREMEAVGSEVRKAKLTYYCRGWWDTLDWRYYTNAGISTVATSTQIETIIESFADAQLKTAEVINASGISTGEHRNGDNTALFEVGELMALGTSNNRRLLSRVTRGKIAEIYEEPVATSTGSVDLDGNLFDTTGGRMQKDICPYGFWVDLRGTSKSGGGFGVLTRQASMFIEGSEYEVDKDELRFMKRDRIGTFDFMRVRNA